MLMVSTPRHRGALLHAHTGRGRGGPRTAPAGMVGLGHRPAHRPRPQDGARLSDGRAPARRPPPVRPRPARAVRPVSGGRFADDPHLWLTTLHDELLPLGWEAGYQSLVRG